MKQVTADEFPNLMVGGREMAALEDSPGGTV